MKKIATLLLAAIILSFAGCFPHVPQQDNPNTNTSSVDQKEAEAIAKLENQLAEQVMTPNDNGTLTMARVDIVTKSTDKNVMDFVTKPVTRDTATAIASYTPGYVIPVEPYYEDCAITVTDKTNQVTLDAADAQVKVRGNWTTSYDKKSLRIKFTEKQNMLGLNDGAQMKNWVLIAEYKDTSKLRDKVLYQMANEILEPDGYYCTDADLVEVTINGKYWGVYLLAEYQQINENRVNITEAEKDYKGTDIGYFLEYDGYYYTENEAETFIVDYHDNAPLTLFDGSDNTSRTETVFPVREDDKKRKLGFTIKSDIYCEEQRDFIANFVNGVYDIMYEAAYNNKAYEFNADYTALVKSDLTPLEAVEKVVDVNSLVDMYILYEVACDADGYWSSFFMSVDFGEGGNRKLTFTAPWDFDSAMANVNSGSRCADAQGYFATNSVLSTNNKFYAMNPWLTVFAYQDWFWELVSEKWTEIYDAGVFERAIQMLENDSTEYVDCFKRSYKKWDNLSSTPTFTLDLENKGAGKPTYNAAAKFLINWLKARVEFLNNEWHK